MGIAIKDLFGLGIDIHWYGIIICCGIILGAITAVQLAKRKGYKSDLIIDFLFLALPLAIIGARAYFVASRWEEYAGTGFLNIIAIWEGGLAIYGGVIGAIVAAVIFCSWKKIPIGDLLDFGAPALILGQAIGRWGNFFNQEAFGRPIPAGTMHGLPYSVGIEIPHSIYAPETGWVACEQAMDANGVCWHEATFFYESIWNLLIFAFMLWYFNRAKHKGNVFVTYLIGYGFGRFFIEGMRSDSLYTGGLRVSQVVAGACVVLGLAYIIFMHFRAPKAKVYNGKYSLAYDPKAAASDVKEIIDEPVVEDAAEQVEKNAADVSAEEGKDKEQ